MLDLQLSKRYEKLLPFRVVNELHNKAVRPRWWVMHDIQKADNIGATSEISQYLDLTLDLALCDRLEDLDDTCVLGRRVYSSEYLEHVER